MSNSQEQSCPPQQRKTAATDSIESLEAGMRSMEIATSSEDSSGQQLILKGPKKVADQSSQAASKAESRLHQITSPASSSVSGHAVTATSMRCLVSPIAQRVPIWSPMAQPTLPPPPQPSDMNLIPDDSALDNFLNSFDMGNYGNTVPGVPPASFAEKFVYVNPMPQQSPQPLPPALASGPSSVCTVVAPVPTSFSAKQQSGPPVSQKTREALLDKLQGRTGQRMVDENFNTPLHNAVLHQSEEDMDFLLGDLKSKKKLMPIINLLNSSGHTPLSLCLKHRRSDLIPMLLNYDAAPTQLCGAASERTNHFHYAMCKCLDSMHSLQVVEVFVRSVLKHCSMDLSGLQARNRHGKTAMDIIAMRITQLNSQPDQASLELLNALKLMYSWISTQI